MTGIPSLKCAGRTLDPIVRRGQVRSTTSSLNTTTSTTARRRDTNKHDTRTVSKSELVIHHYRPILLQQQLFNNPSSSYPCRQIIMTDSDNLFSHSRPLSSCSTISTKDPNIIWQNWFQSDEYRPLWQTPPPQSSSSPSSTSPLSSSLYLQPLPNLQLDNASQFILSLLSDMTHNIWRGTDLATSQRCNHILRLLIVEALVVDENDPVNAKWCYADRAYLVWKNVEMCYDAVQKRHGGGGGGGGGCEASLKIYEPPRLDRDVYIELTKIYATANRKPITTSSSSQNNIGLGVERDTAERIQDVVTTMTNRYLQSGNLDLRPNVVLWN